MPSSSPSDSGGEEPPIEDLVDPFDEFRPPLPPEDRIWRHPSEVAAASRLRPPPPPPPPAPSGRISVATVAISALIGATLSLGIVAALGGFDTRVVERRVAVDLAARDTSGARGGHSPATESVVGMSVRVGDDWVTQNALVLRSDGHLLTSAGPLAASDAVEVHLPDGTTVDAEVVGVDPDTDVAVVRIAHRDLVPAVIGTSSDVAVGDDATAVGLRPGSPWSPVMTPCMVRAVGQRALADGTTLHDVAVIDADPDSAIAGSTVLDDRGAVVGVVASATTGISDGAVVIPIDVAVHIADEIVEFGRARNVWLGVGGHDLTRDEAGALDVSGGAAITSVVDDSPAQRAGIEAGDVIVAVDGETIESMSALVVELRERDPGETVEIVAVRDGEKVVADAELSERAGS